MSSDFLGGPGFLAFVVTFALVVAGILLFLSLSRHLRKVRSRDARERAQAAGASESSAERGSGGAEGGDRGGDEVAGEPGDRQ